MKISLKAFITAGTTLLTGLVTCFVIFIYTDIIKREVYLSAGQEVQGLFEKEKKTVLRMIQLGTFLELNQQLSFSYKNEPLVKGVEVYLEDEVVASYEIRGLDEKSGFKKYRFPLVEHDQIWGVVNILVDQKVIEEKISQRLKGLYTIGFIIIVITVFLSYLFSILITREVNKVITFIFSRHQSITSASNLGELEMKLGRHLLPKSFLKEISSLSKAFDGFLMIVKDANSRLNMHENEARLGQQAQQIAHDIRSPLEVLKGLRKDLESLPEGARRRVQMSIQRIEEIASNLLRTHKNVITSSESLLQPEDLLSLLEGLVVEKRIEYAPKDMVEISCNFDSNSYGLLSNVRRGALKRVISNLMNNAIEALGDRPGKVELKLYSEKELNIIEVSDTGAGIPEEFKDKLFKRGFTSKENGNGLGLFGAVEEVSSLGGSLNFDSRLGHGTTFRIHLPKAENSSKLLNGIDAYKYQGIIILDDDPAFHEMWKNKFDTCKAKIEYYFSIKEMFIKYDVFPPGFLLLTDFELMDGDHDGIDVILKYGSQENSILVTARYEEKEIREKCRNNEIKILPKSLVKYIKITFAPDILGMESAGLQVVLIDDDHLIRLNWSMYCKKNDIPFSAFKSVQEFISASSSVDKQAKIFIDSSLGDGIKGELESEKIFKLGFLNLYLATGYEKDSIDKPDWIKEIYSKSPENISKDSNLL